MTLESSLLYSREDGNQDFVHDTYRDFFAIVGACNAINKDKITSLEVYSNYSSTPNEKYTKYGGELCCFGAWPINSTRSLLPLWEVIASFDEYLPNIKILEPRITNNLFPVDEIVKNYIQDLDSFILTVLKHDVTLAAKIATSNRVSKSVKEKVYDLVDTITLALEECCIVKDNDQFFTYYDLYPLGNDRAFFYVTSRDISTLTRTSLSLMRFFGYESSRKEDEVRIKSVYEQDEQDADILNVLCALSDGPVRISGPVKDFGSKKKELEVYLNNLVGIENDNGKHDAIYPATFLLKRWNEFVTSLNLNKDSIK